MWMEGIQQTLVLQIDWWWQNPIAAIQNFGTRKRRWRCWQSRRSTCISCNGIDIGNYINLFSFRGLLTLIRESWKKNPKRGTVTERVFGKKNPERSIEKICICFCALDLFSRNDAQSRSQKMAYIFVQHGIFSLIWAYAIWNWHHKIALLTLFLHI